MSARNPQAQRSSRRHGIDGIDDQIGEKLAQLSLESFDTGLIVKTYSILIPAKGILRALLCGYVSDDCRISYNRSARPSHGRDRHQHLHSPSVTADTLSLVTSNAFPLVETSKVGGNLLPALGR